MIWAHQHEVHRMCGCINEGTRHYGLPCMALDGLLVADGVCSFHIKALLEACRSSQAVLV